MSTRRDYVDIAEALRGANEDAETDCEREGIRHAADAVSRLFASNSRGFDEELFMRNCGFD